MSIMATDDIIDDIDRDPEEVDEVSAFVGGIERMIATVEQHETRATVASDGGDPETLSKVLPKLARANSQLGRLAAKAKYHARLADRAYREARDRLKLDLITSGMSIGKAESKAYVESGALFEAFNEIQLMADEADDRCYRTDTFLKMAQSRLSLIKNDANRP